MKTKLIAFDVTKALETSVGEIVAGIDGSSPTAKEQLVQAGIPNLPRALDQADFGLIQKHFSSERENLDPYAIALELSKVLPRPVNVSDGRLYIDLVNLPDIQQWLAVLRGLDQKIKLLVAGLGLAENGLVDSDLNSLEGFDNLETLELSSNRIGSKGAIKLGKFSRLEALYLRKNPIGNRGIPPLTKLRRLKFLLLSGTKINDRAYDSLVRIPFLEELSINDVSLTVDLLLALKARFRQVNCALD